MNTDMAPFSVKRKQIKTRINERIRLISQEIDNLQKPDMVEFESARKVFLDAYRGRTGSISAQIREAIKHIDGVEIVEWSPYLFGPRRILSGRVQVLIDDGGYAIYGGSISDDEAEKLGILEEKNRLNIAEASLKMYEKTKGDLDLRKRILIEIAENMGYRRHAGPGRLWCGSEKYFYTMSGIVKEFCTTDTFLEAVGNKLAVITNNGETYSELPYSEKEWSEDMGSIAAKIASETGKDSVWYFEMGADGIEEDYLCEKV